MNQNNPLIQAEALEKTYEDGTAIRALDGISLAIAKGEFLAVQGPSGSGKTTLLNLIGTLDDPTSGKIWIDGNCIGDLSGNALADFRRANIGFIFQLFNLIPTLTAIENVKLPLLPYRRKLAFKLDERAHTLMEQVGLAQRWQHLPGQLSGGEQQRVAIARALINHPKLILADEPTGNLDSESGKDIMQLLQSLKDEFTLTIIIVTHDDAIASQADRILYMQDGRFLEDG